MRGTSASASANSLVTSAASRALCDFACSEPGMTRIFGVAMSNDGQRERTDFARHHTRRSVGCRPSSVAPIDPHPRGRNVHPYPLGGFRAHAIEPLGDRRNGVVGELHEGRARRHQREGLEQQPQARAQWLGEERQARHHPPPPPFPPPPPPTPPTL